MEPLDELAQRRRAISQTTDTVKPRYHDGGPWPLSWLWCQVCGLVSHSGRDPKASTLDLPCGECGSGLCVTPHDGPWLAGLFRCRACDYRFVSAHPFAADEGVLECPRCHAQASDLLHR